MNSSTEGMPVVPTEELEAVTNEKVAERKSTATKTTEKQRNSKLTKKLSTDNQLLAVAKEDLQLKRKALDQMEEANK